MAQEAVGLDFKDEFVALAGQGAVGHLAAEVVGDGVLLAESAKEMLAGQGADG